MKKSSSDKISTGVQFFCNGVPESEGRGRGVTKLSLEYHRGQQVTQNVTLKHSEFIKSVVHLPIRIQDLLEIAAYVFCADRHCSRGRRDALEYHDWSREFEYFIKVRDHEFWNRKDVKEILTEAVTWVTGDRDHRFNFMPGQDTVKTHLFDSEEFSLDEQEMSHVVLFSGGLDSLSGMVDLLETKPDSVWAISHSSANPSTIRTQTQLIMALKDRYLGRVNHRVLECHLHGFRAPEETQRTRAFLYCSMALAMATALKQRHFYLYENGITALNFRKRAGMFNARSSRTAHPRTIRLIRRLFSLIAENDFEIRTPFAFKTKTEVVELLKGHQRLDLVNSTVSCSKTYHKLRQATHCGQCSQCIDRRFAMYAAQCEEDDEGGIYAFDFITEPIDDGETRTGLIDYLRQARTFAQSNIDYFNLEMLDQLTDAIDEQGDDYQQIENLHSLCQRHGKQVETALQRIVKPFQEYQDGALWSILGARDYMRPVVYELASALATEVEAFIRQAFSRNRPVNEADLNAKISAYLGGHKERFQKEHPCLSFASARAVPDHSAQDLLIEAKYIRGSTSPSVATEGIAADLTKYPDLPLKLFIVFDPEGRITERNVFKRDFERKRHCMIHII